MFFVGKVLVAELIKTACFACNIKACQSSCCIDGDRGAPLTRAEAELIRQHEARLLNLLDASYLTFASRNGLVLEEIDETGQEQLYTNIMPREGPCVFLLADDDCSGLKPCLIEFLYKKGELPFNKPISCHLFPLIVKERKDCITLTCEERYTCRQSWGRGSLLIESCQEALVRQFGLDFYNKLYNTIKNSKKT